MALPENKKIEAFTGKIYSGIDTAFEKLRQKEKEKINLEHELVNLNMEIENLRTSLYMQLTGKTEDLVITDEEKEEIFKNLPKTSLSRFGIISAEHLMQFIGVLTIPEQNQYEYLKSRLHGMIEALKEKDIVFLMNSIWGRQLILKFIFPRKSANSEHLAYKIFKYCNKFNENIEKNIILFNLVTHSPEAVIVFYEKHKQIGLLNYAVILEPESLLPNIGLIKDDAVAVQALMIAFIINPKEIAMQFLGTNIKKAVIIELAKRKGFIDLIPIIGAANLDGFLNYWHLIKDEKEILKAFKSIINKATLQQNPHFLNPFYRYVVPELKMTEDLKNFIVEIAPLNPNEFIISGSKFADDSMKSTIINLIPKITDQYVARNFVMEIFKIKNISLENKKIILDCLIQTHTMDALHAEFYKESSEIQEIVKKSFRESLEKIKLKDLFKLESDNGMFYRLNYFKIPEFIIDRIKKTKELIQTSIRKDIKQLEKIIKLHQDELPKLQVLLTQIRSLSPEQVFKKYSKTKEIYIKELEGWINRSQNEINTCAGQLSNAIGRFASDERLQEIMQIDDSWIDSKISRKENRYEMMIKVARKLWYQNKPIIRENVITAQNEIAEELKTYKDTPLIKGRTIFHLYDDETLPNGSYVTDGEQIKKTVDKQGGTIKSEFNERPQRTYESIVTLKKRYLNFLRYQKGNIGTIVDLHGSPDAIHISITDVNKIKGGETKEKKYTVMKLTYDEIAQALIDRRKNVKDETLVPTFLMNNCHNNEFSRKLLAAVQQKAPGLIIAGSAESGQLAWGKVGVISDFFNITLNMKSADKDNPTTVGTVYKNEHLTPNTNPTVIIQRRTGETTQVVERNERRRTRKTSIA